MTGEKFIENLEKINKRRVVENPDQAEDKPAAAAAGVEEEKLEG